MQGKQFCDFGECHRPGTQRLGENTYCSKHFREGSVKLGTPVQTPKVKNNFKKRTKKK